MSAIAGIALGLAAAAYVLLVFFVFPDLNHLMTHINHCGTLHTFKAVTQCLHKVTTG